MPAARADSRFLARWLLLGVGVVVLFASKAVFGQKPATPTKALNTKRDQGSDLRVKNVNGRGYIGVKGLAGFYGFQSWDVSGTRIAMTSKTKQGTIQFVGTIGQKRISLGNLAFYLSFPPIANKSEGALISVQDVSNVLDPVLRGHVRRDPSMLRTIVLDPAAGGSETGISTPYGAEKDVTLALALKMKPLLEKEGFTVLMTREDDSAVFALERIRLANLLRSESVYVSLKAATSSEPKVRGVETSTLPPANTPATVETEKTEPDRRYYPGNINDRESMALATTLHSRLIKNVKTADLGIKRSRDLELRAIEMPAVVCRVGFLSNKEEAAQLQNEASQAVLAQALVDGLKTYGDFLKRGLDERNALDAQSPLKFGKLQATVLDSEAGISGERMTVKIPIVAKKGTHVDRSKLEVQLFLFERVNGTEIDLSIASSPKIEWLSVLPDWKAIQTELMQAIYDRPAMNSVEMAKLGRRNYYGFVARLVYDGRLLDEFAEPKNLNRGLYYFTPLFPLR